ncbi:MAG: biopolymer transporter ExbD [Planctomycetaceae bacterium]|nr:biopolymer transporter ExbD [Planctomycetaceae bacterium]
MLTIDEPLLDEDEPIVLRCRALEEPELDITPMIDLTFLLLIFFLVTSVPDVQRALELPPARHGVAADPRTSLIVTLAVVTPGQAPAVFLGDGRVGAALPGDSASQEAALKQAARQAVEQGKSAVLIKAERGVLHRDVARVSAAASSVGNLRVHVAVLEIE